jgi:predicted transcriptional regulator
MAQAEKRHGRPNIVGVDKGIGPLEAQVLRAVSEVAHPVTVREVCDRLVKDGYFAYQGVLNCMNRLTQKGILSREERQGAYLYHALVDIEELTAQVMENVLGHMGGQLDRVICRMLHIDPDEGAKEIARLREKLATPAKRKR